jgi:hypothetical protein
VALQLIPLPGIFLYRVPHQVHTNHSAAKTPSLRSLACPREGGGGGGGGRGRDARFNLASSALNTIKNLSVCIGIDSPREYSVGFKNSSSTSADCVGSC